MVYNAIRISYSVARVRPYGEKTYRDDEEGDYSTSYKASGYSSAAVSETVSFMIVKPRTQC